MKKSAVLPIALTSAVIIVGCAGLAVSSQVKSNPHKVAECVPLSDVQLTAGPLYQRQKVNNEYIAYTIKPDRMLAPFMLQAGLQPKAQRYDGWEDGELSGHAMGHFLSALAYVYDISKDEKMREQTKTNALYIVDELAKLQQKDGEGYTMPMPKSTYTRLRNNDVRPQPFNLNGIWSPFYTYHKVMAGLRDVYHKMGYRPALDVEKGLADFVISCVSPLTEENVQRMLSCEFGGMQEVLADLSVDLNDRKYLDAANKYFYHKALMDPLEQGRDHLTGRHGNTMIPEMVGMGRIYEISGDEKYRKISEFFYDRVANYRSYATGGNGEGEYFFQIGDEARHLTSHTTESCNCYNMLKLARLVYEWNPKTEIMDYVERVTLNHIASVCGAERQGEYGYFQPLASVAVKDFSSSEHVWTCCVGTGLENPARYGEQICAIDNDTVYLNQFWDADVRLTPYNGSISISGGFPYADKTDVRFALKSAKNITVKVRKPYWSKSLELSVNGAPVESMLGEDGYAAVTRKWKDGDILSIRFDFKLRIVPMNEKKDVPVCIMYGPFVMAGIVPENAANRAQRRQARDHRSYETEPSLLFESEEDIVSRLKPTGQFAHFRSSGLIVPEDLEFVPLLEIYRQYYAVYFSQKKNLPPTDSEIAQRTIDEINPGFQQSEIDHKGIYNDTQVYTNQLDGSKARFAPANDWFGYTMGNVPNQNLTMIVRFFGRNSHISLTVNGKSVIDEDFNSREEATRVIRITPDMRDASGNLVLVFKGSAEKPSPNIRKIILCKDQ